MSKFKSGDRIRCSDPAMLRFSPNDRGLARKSILIVTEKDSRVPFVSYLDGSRAGVIHEDDFELVTCGSDPVDWLKTNIVKADENGDDTAFDYLTRMLRECYGIEARPKSVTTWIFEPVQP